MEHKILIVDDDAEFLTSLVSQFKDSQNIFDMITASDGAEALNILKTTAISLVVSDVQMPVMDGFILLAYISGLYPDIPVIMINDPGEVGAEEAALESGAVAYLEKPFTPKQLLHTISETFKKMSDGGQLTNVSLEMFIQLFEMEQKTCTIRVQDKKTNNIGTLFLKNGELLNARVNEVEGNEAAYEILSWKDNFVTISDSCPMEIRLIDGDNQAILMEAAQRKEKALLEGKVAEWDETAQIREILGKDTHGTDGDKAKGGKLTHVSLETFIQLFQMEEKTCTLIIENTEKNLKGILYFQNGQLLDAKLNYILGKEAALKILSWDKVNIEIGFDTEVTEKRIAEDLQEILLDAMRLRDEGEMQAEDFEEDIEKTPIPDASIERLLTRTGNQTLTKEDLPRPPAETPSFSDVKSEKHSGVFKRIWSRIWNRES